LSADAEDRPFERVERVRAALPISPRLKLGDDRRGKIHPFGEIAHAPYGTAGPS